MDIIAHLVNTVSSKVLRANAPEKQADLLKQFYAIFATRLASDEVNSGIDTMASGPDFIQQVFSKTETRDDLVNKLAEFHQVDTTTTSSLISDASPLAFAELVGLANGRPLSEFLGEHLSTLSTKLPSWAMALMPAGILGLLGAAGDKVGAVADKTADLASDAYDSAKATVSSGVNAVGDAAEKVVDEGSSLFKTLLPIIAIIILGLLAWWLLKSCQSQNATTPPVAEPQTAEIAPATEMDSLLPAELILNTDANGELSLAAASVGSDDLSAKLDGAIKGVYPNSTPDINIDATQYDTNMPAIDQLPQALALIKTVPNAEVVISGDSITIDAPDAEAANTLLESLKGLLPNFIITAPNLAVDAAPIISDTEPSAYFEDGIMKFYFATGKADVAGDAHDKAAEIVQAAKDGKKLAISGFTDSTGDAAANAELSKQRAQAVQAFLIGEGVPEAQLELVKPEDTVGAVGKDQEGRRVEVSVME